MSYVLGNPHCSFPKMMCLMFRKVEELAEHWVFNMRCMRIGRISGDELKVRAKKWNSEIKLDLSMEMWIV